MSDLMIVSEDSATKTFQTLRNIIQLISENESLDLDDIKDSPKSLKRIAWANAWLSKHHSRVDLLRLVANVLDKEKMLLAWHIDGDCEFSSFDKTKGNVAKLQSLINDLPDELPVARGRGTVPVYKDNVLMMIPCYSIEAWLFQSKNILSEVKQLYIQQLEKVNEKTKPSRLTVIKNIEFLESLNPDDFDETIQIKNHFPQKRSDKYPAMAEHITHDELMKVNKSYALFVNNLKEALA